LILCRRRRCRVDERGLVPSPMAEEIDITKVRA
jgi:hypothetical protein